MTEQPEPYEFILHRSDMEEFYDSLSLAVGKEYADNMWETITIRSRPHTPASEQISQPEKCGVTYCGIQSGMCAFLPEKQKCSLLTQEEAARAAALATLDEYEKKMWVELQSCGISRDVAKGIFLNARSKIGSLRQQQEREQQ